MQRGHADLGHMARGRISLLFPGALRNRRVPVYQEDKLNSARAVMHRPRHAEALARQSRASLEARFEAHLSSPLMSGIRRIPDVQALRKLVRESLESPLSDMN